MAVAEDADPPASELADAKLLGVENLTLRDPLALVARGENEARKRVVKRERDGDDVLGDDDLLIIRQRERRNDSNMHDEERTTWMPDALAQMSELPSPNDL